MHRPLHAEASLPLPPTKKDPARVSDRGIAPKRLRLRCVPSLGYTILRPWHPIWLLDLLAIGRGADEIPPLPQQHLDLATVLRLALARPFDRVALRTLAIAQRSGFKWHLQL